MLKIKVDNDDGSIDWDQRARLAVAFGMYLEYSLKEIIGKNTNSEFAIACRKHYKNTKQRLKRLKKNESRNKRA